MKYNITYRNHILKGPMNKTKVTTEYLRLRQLFCNLEICEVGKGDTQVQCT